MCILGVFIFELYRFLFSLLRLRGYISQKKAIQMGVQTGVQSVFLIFPSKIQMYILGNPALFKSLLNGV